MSEFELSATQRALLASVLDELIPPDRERGLPGAGEVGVGAHIEKVLRVSPELQPMVTEGLSALGAGFRELPPTQRRELLSQQGFLFFLMFHGYAGYYQQPQVLSALGLEPRPPHPQGYEMGPDDFSLLDPVRARKPLYRRLS